MWKLKNDSCQLHLLPLKSVGFILWETATFHSCASHICVFNSYFWIKVVVIFHKERKLPLETAALKPS